MGAHKQIPTLILAVALSVSAFAQVSITGQIRGTVTDASGALVPDVRVTATSPALMAARVSVSQKDGSYLLEQLPPGTYDINFAAPNFKGYLQRGIVLTPGFTATINPTLQVGQIEQSVEVTSDAPVVDVKGNETATTFDASLLQGIPSGRDTWSTVEQAPGTTPDRFDVAGNQSFQQSVLEVHGSQPGEQVYSFNGLRMNWPGSSGGFTAFYVDNDALQEFQVVSDNAPAEVGVGGVYMNMVPKSGSNALHGLAAIYYDTAATQADISEPSYNGQKVNVGSPIIMTRDTSANLGGPLIKNRWWLFGSWRYYNIKESILSVRRQDGSPIADINHQTDTVLRSDYQLNTNNRLNFVWWYNGQNRFFRRDEGFAYVSEKASWRQIEPAYIVQGQWNNVLKNNLVFDTRFGYMHLLFPLGAQTSVGPNDFSRLDYTLQTIDGAPIYTFLNPAQVLSFATGGSYYRGNLAGSHNFKFGFETSTNRNGYFYDAVQGINAIYLSGVPSQVTAYNFPLRQWSIFHETALYGQDAWTIGKRLTINAGLRFEHFRTFNPPQKSPQAYFPQLFSTRSFPQSADLASWNTVQPRLGIAFDLSGKGTSVLRAAFDRFDLIQGTQLAEALNPNGFSSQTFDWKDANGDKIPQTNEWLDLSQVQQSAGGAFTHVDPNLKRPFSQEVNVGYEQQIFGSVRVGANYYYRSTKQLFASVNRAHPASDYVAVTRSLDGSNTPIVNPLTNQPMTLYNLPVNPGASDFLITNIGALEDNAYHALEFTGTRRMTRNWQMLAGFTIQRKKGTYGRGLGDDFNNPNNNILRTNNILDYDSTYVFKLDGTYVLPFQVSVSANFQHYTGYALDAQSSSPPTAVFDVGLNQGPVTAIIANRGNIRLDPVNLLNMRLSRPTNITERVKLEPLIDFFNVTNASTVTQKISTNAPGIWLKPADLGGNPGILNPFIARFGLRLSF